MKFAKSLILLVTALVITDTVNGAAEDIQKCSVTTDCTDNPWYECNLPEVMDENTIEMQGICLHKGVFPMEILEYFGIVVFALLMAMANIAGIGGGGVAIPIVMAFFHFNTKPAIAISSFSIFMTTLARFVMNFKLPHPEKKHSVVIDYNLVTIMMPTTLAGAQIGAFILVIFPSLYIQIALTITLIILGAQSTKKAIDITKKENEDAKKKKVGAEKPEDSERQAV